MDATMDLFSEVGYAPQGCAGAAKGAPYHHFNSKKRWQLPSSTKAPNPTDDAFRHARRARAEGDLREGFDPCAMRESILNAMLGAHLLAATADASDHIKRLTRALKLLLPAIVADTSLAYVGEFLAPRVPTQPPSHRFDWPSTPAALSLVNPEPLRQVLKRDQHNRIIGTH
jgi:hypothetical protein